MSTARKNVLILIIITGFLLIAGCAAKPSKSIVEKAIVKYYMDRGYGVVSLKIDEIREIPLSEKQYMGTPGYIVNVASVVLEITKNKNESTSYGKEQRLSFNDIRIRIKKSAIRGNEWVITEITGM